MNSSRQGKVCIFHKVMQECQTVFLLSNFNFFSKFSMEQVTNFCWAHKTVQLITQRRVKAAPEMNSEEAIRARSPLPSSGSHLDADTISGCLPIQDMLKRQHGFTVLWHQLLPPEHALGTTAVLPFFVGRTVFLCQGSWKTQPSHAPPTLCALREVFRCLSFCRGVHGFVLEAPTPMWKCHWPLVRQLRKKRV